MLRTWIKWFLQIRKLGFVCRNCKFNHNYVILWSEF